MITGYNTDIQHLSVTLHVQTEDKGEGNPCIESLVYVGGQILARKRSGYQRLLAEGAGKQDIVDLMEEQHKAMIDKIRRGRLDEQLVAMGAVPMAELEPAAAAVEPHAEAAAAPSGPTLDQVILDYLNAEADQEHLVLVMDTRGPLALGKSAFLAFETRTSLSDEPVGRAAIKVKLISTSAEPIDLGEGETDPDGRLELRVELPALVGGTAALIVNATSVVGTAEIKHLI